ncbi:acyl-CoA desaturase [Leptolyngbyaceae cyanobacterium CCMR0082]|uniref:Acyl-CoA desaturase n=2 Tax=Adonisia turfae TaxID=2950184 RepID=A0A6M0S4M9_9CYAN|nr:acyl-CoA desaturase [Adonisia turfae]MDV3350620.1 acyl-CoA desaturase [Leptothoe sp. LEGE 181152]NEZ55331.1 acyl-CoA desaturase [Adonisia turfae CCMR0081]NEZ63464.1 acyl-CoA desaturase [Adonisia turfae CCMR0082]
MTVANVPKPPINWPTAIFMVAVHSIALLAFLPSNFSWSAIAVALFLHWVTGCLGITLGWHRLVAHRSFTVPKWLEYFFVFCGSLACQHGPIEWIGLHRHHHAHSDQPVDHHSSTKGFWWSHMGWIFYEVPADGDVPRLTKDIARDPFYLFCENYFLLMQVALGLLLYVIGGWSFVLWGIFVRLVAVYHCTWFVNSATHKFGYKTFESNDYSTNCWWVAVVTYGEGWHNNHHAFQFSARHGLKWWEIDVTWMTIQLLSKLGLATKVKIPKQEDVQAALLS